jgi:hypothetical protein
MADTVPVFFDELRSITDEDLAKFFLHVGASGKCPVCGTNDWHRLPDDGKGKNYAIPNFPGPRGYRVEPLHVVALFCAKCGFVRQHATHVIYGVLNELNHG